jgi:hypothetical protein
VSRPALLVCGVLLGAAAVLAILDRLYLEARLDELAADLEEARDEVDACACRGCP